MSIAGGYLNLNYQGGGGDSVTGYDMNKLAKRYNAETASLNGCRKNGDPKPKVTKRTVTELPLILGV